MVLDRRYSGVLRRGRTRDRDQGLAGGVRNQMEVEITGVRHLYSNRIACGYRGSRPRLKALSKLTQRLSAISIHMAAARDDIGAPIRTPRGDVDSHLGLSLIHISEPTRLGM